MQLLGCSDDVDDDAVGVEIRAPEGRIDDVRRAVEPLRGPECLAAQAVGDHHVIADGHAEHGYPSPYVIVWHTAGRLPAASRAITSGNSSKRDSPVRSASNAGSRSSSRASASRSAVVRREARAGESVPTWLERMPRRPAWNAPAEREPHLGVAVPAEVDDGCLRCEQFERALQACRRRARVHGEVAAAVGLLREGEVDPEGRRDTRAARGRRPRG